MRIGINLLYLRPGWVGGSETYVRELIHQFSLSNNQLIIFCTKQVSKTISEDNIEKVEVSSRSFSQFNRLIDENITLNFLIKKHNIDVLFSPANFSIPLLTRDIPQVCTIHDLQHHWLTENFTFFQKIFRTIMFKMSLLCCRNIIAISEFTKRDILNHYKIREENITVVYHGIAENFFNSDSILETTKVKFGLKEKYYYYPSAMFRHKNHITLLEAFCKVREETGEDIQLIFTGAQSDMYPIVQEYIKRLGLLSSVKHLGFVSRQEVFAILAMAKALVFPSEFEGFGFPVLEAMRCGTPVIASNITSIPEIAGNAALLIDPFNVIEWVNAMRTILSDDAMRETMISRGYQQVQKFTWGKCVEETLEVLKKSTQ